jgi:hypothetical protein
MAGIRRKLSYANVAATVALFVAIGGGGGAVAVASTASNTYKANSTAVNPSRGPRGPRGLRGPRGIAGPKGDVGATGPAGAAGSALGFAEIAANGTIEAGNNVQIVSHNASHGVYCLKLTTGSPQNVVAMIDNSGTDPRSAFVAGSTNAAALTADCPAGSEIEIATGDVGVPASQGDFADKPFYVLIN